MKNNLNNLEHSKVYKPVFSYRGMKKGTCKFCGEIVYRNNHLNGFVHCRTRQYFQPQETNQSPQSKIEELKEGGHKDAVQEPTSKISIPETPRHIPQSDSTAVSDVESEKLNTELEKTSDRALNFNEEAPTEPKREDYKFECVSCGACFDTPNDKDCCPSCEIGDYRNI